MKQTEVSTQKAVIIYNKFLNDNGTQATIGGIQTYIFHLCNLLITMGIKPIVLQSAKSNFDTIHNNIHVIGIKNTTTRTARLFGKKNIRTILYEKAMEIISPTNGLLIFGADQISVKTNYSRAISIMHGIYWDLPVSFLIAAGGRYSVLNKLPFISKSTIKKYFIRKKIDMINNVPNVVCVDHNYINWYRTQIPETIDNSYHIIPNFVKIPTGYEPNIDRQSENGQIRILFARRFFEYRGTHIMVKAIKRLLAENLDIEVVFAGEGPDKEYIYNNLKQYENFYFDKYTPQETLQFHKKFHIAVVPSLASEGTSLSLAEAMAAGCAVIGSNVGGITNMLIDQYNGLMIMPTEDELYEALVTLIESSQTREQLAKNAYHTITSGFSHNIWTTKWKKVIHNITE